VSAKPKHALGDFIPLQWEDAPSIYYVRGHVAPGSPEELKGFSEIEADEGYDPGAVKNWVEPGRHVFARWQFPESGMDCDRMLVEYKVKSRGCFPVTAYYLKKGV
jgi:hypothetical protein